MSLWASRGALTEKVLRELSPEKKLQRFLQLLQMVEFFEGRHFAEDPRSLGRDRRHDAWGCGVQAPTNSRRSRRATRVLDFDTGLRASRTGSATPLTQGLGMVCQVPLSFQDGTTGDSADSDKGKSSKKDRYSGTDRHRDKGSRRDKTASQFPGAPGTILHREPKQDRSVAYGQ